MQHYTSLSKAEQNELNLFFPSRQNCLQLFALYIQYKKELLVKQIKKREGRGKGRVGRGGAKLDRGGGGPKNLELLGINEIESTKHLESIIANTFRNQKLRPEEFNYWSE